MANGKVWCKIHNKFCAKTRSYYELGLNERHYKINEKICTITKEIIHRYNAGVV